MNRRFAVLGLAVAMCGTGSAVAGQLSEAEQMARREAALRNRMVLADPATSSTGDQVQPGQLSGTYASGIGPLLAVRMESVGPQLSPLHLTRNGVEEWTFESTVFTISPGTSGTTITSSDVVTVTRPGSQVSISGFALRISADGTIWTLDGSPIRK